MTHKLRWSSDKVAGGKVREILRSTSERLLRAVGKSREEMAQHGLILGVGH
jgi:hypothetical protein